VNLAVVAAGLGAATWLTARLRTPTVRLPSAESPQVSVIVPARNEARVLPRALESLQAQHLAPLEVVVVDDDSSDGTAGVARAHGCRVVRTSPPAGWLGKPWACHTGAAEARGTHLLFLDADTWLAPDAIEVLLGEHTARGGLLSVQPYHETSAAYEELSAYPNAVAVMASGSFAAIRPAPAAFGPCLLTTAADYHRVGGHAAVADQVVDDLRLAHRYHACGLPVTCLAGGSVVRYQMYPGGLRDLADGWTKNLAAGATATSPLAVAGTVLWVGAHATVAWATVAAVLRWALRSGRVPDRELAAWAAVSAHLGWLLRRIGSFRLWTAIGFPVPLAAFVGLFVRSAARRATGRAVYWRGRPVQVGIQAR
jgi:4,4'-diaponeurosporenoate glycosyltransferase